MEFFVWFLIDWFVLGDFALWGLGGGCLVELLEFDSLRVFSFFIYVEFYLVC